MEPKTWYGALDLGRYQGDLSLQCRELGLARGLELLELLGQVLALVSVGGGALGAGSQALHHGDEEDHEDKVEDRQI